MRVTAGLVGILGAIAAALLGWLTVGWVVGAVAGVAVLSAGMYAAWMPPGKARLWLTVGVAAVAVGAVATVGIGLLLIGRGLTDTAGAADPAPAEILEPARMAAAAATAEGSFRLELTRGEFEALLQSTLEAEPTAARSIRLSGLEGDTFDFAITLKNGGWEARGRAAAATDSGRLSARVLDAEVGVFTMWGPGVDTVEDVLSDALDLPAALGDPNVELQGFAGEDDRVVLVGQTSNAAEAFPSDQLAAFIDAQVDRFGAVVPPEEILAYGTATDADGESYYVALGGSLAAAAGSDDPTAGYVSRLHRHLSERDGIAYGLRNFAQPGATTSGLVRSQLEPALAFIRGNPVAYVTIDAGADDLFAHLGSADCLDNLFGAPCQERLTATFNTAGANLATVFAELAAAAPDAVIVALTPYNPYAFGFAGIEYSALTTTVVEQFNQLIFGLVEEAGISRANGQATIGATTGATTNILRRNPDPMANTIGHDLLTEALIVALR